MRTHIVWDATNFALGLQQDLLRLGGVWRAGLSVVLGPGDHPLPVRSDEFVLALEGLDAPGRRLTHIVLDGIRAPIVKGRLPA